MIDMLRAYLQIASGVGEVTRQRALEAARAALAASPAGVVLPVATAGVDGLTAQVSALADDLLASGRANRELLRQLVRAEVETVVTRLGLGGQGDLEAQLAASRAHVRELEQSLARVRTGKAPRTSTATTKAATKRAATTKAATKRAATTKAATKRAATTKAATKRSAATKKAATKKAAQKKPATPRTAAKKAAPKRAATKKSAAAGSAGAP